jgi:hypothetical protein
MKASGTLPMDLYSLEQVMSLFAHDNSDAMGNPDVVIQERQLDVTYIASYGTCAKLGLPRYFARGWARRIEGEFAWHDGGTHWRR